MPPRHPNSIPKWAIRAAQDGVTADLEECAYIGVEPLSKTPRLPTRVLPENGSSSLSAISTADLILLNQRMMQFVGFDLAYGIQQFNDLRQLPADLRKLTRIRIEPFQEGSFIIPAVLENEPVDVMTGSGKKRYTGHDIIEKFAEVLHGIERHGAGYATSIGMRQSLRDLAPILRREKANVEYQPSTRVSLDPIFVTADLLKDLETAYVAMVVQSTATQKIEGLVTEVDLAKGTFHLHLDGGDTIEGRYSDFIRNVAPSILGQRVICNGQVQSKNSVPYFISAFDIEVVRPSIEST